jgi:hypothetical protein
MTAKRQVSFRQIDLQRALRAAMGAGLEVKHVELDPVTGKIIITTAQAGTATQNSSPLDNWLVTHARSS